MLINPRSLVIDWMCKLFFLLNENWIKIGSLRELELNFIAVFPSSKWRKQINSPGRPSLILAIVATFWREYLLLGFICVFNDIFIRLAQPFLLGRLLEYFR